MAVGEGVRRKGGKLDDGSSVIDKRHYGRSRKTRVRPANIADEPPPPLPPPSATADNMAPQQPTSSTTDLASASARPESEPLPSSLPCPSPSPPSSDSTSTSTTHRSSSTKSSDPTISQPLGAPPPTTPREERPRSSSDKQRRRRSRPRRGRDGGGRRGDDASTCATPARHRSSRGGDRRKKQSHSRHRGRLSRSNSRRSRGFSSAADAPSRPGKKERPASTAQSGVSYSSSGGTSGRTFPGGTAASSEEGGTHGRRKLRDDRPDDGSSHSNRQSESREGSSEHDRRRSYRRGKRRDSKARRSREKDRSEDRRSRDSRNYDRRRSSDARKGASDARHRRDSQVRRRHHRRYRSHRRSSSSSSSSSNRSSGGSRESASSSSSSSSRQHRSRDNREGSASRTDHNRRGSGRKQRERKNDRRAHSYGGRRGHSRADDNTATRRRLMRASAGGEAGGEEHVTLEPEKTAAGTNFPSKLKKTAKIAREDSKADALKRRHLHQTTLKAVVTVQCLFRRYIARNRVAGRQEALAFLRGACLGVAIDIIDAFIREDAAPRMIHGILARGFEGGGAGAAQRAEAVAAANTLLAETSASMVRELVTLGLTEEANSHLDAVFVRDRRNPLLATVDDIIAETLRKWMREAVVEAVKEGAEDFMFGRRISELVQVVIEEGIVEAVRPIAAEVYHSGIALAAFSEVEQELCAEEAKLVVAETMAPFEDQLVELQRERDVAAMQAAAHHVMIKGLQLQHAARTVGQRGRLVVMSDINGKTLNLLLAGRFLAILRAAETNRQQVSTSPLLFMLFQRLVVRTGRSVLLEELARELDRDESALHALELERIEELDRHRRRADRDRPTA